MAGEWGTREEFLHPRDSHGRFRKSWKMAASVIEKISAALEKFSPKTFPDQGQANNYVRGLAQSDRFGSNRGAFMDRFLKGFSNVNADLRAGKPNADAAAMDKAMRPLPDDLILSRTVGPEAFGLDASNIGQLEEYTGKLISDKGFSSTNVGTPHRRQGGITMVIAAPAGTRAVAPSTGSPTSEVILDRDQPFRITKVTPDGTGGYYVMAVATEKGGAGQVRTKKLGTAAPTPNAEEIAQAPAVPGQAPQAPGAPAPALQAPQAPAPQAAPVRTGKPGRPAHPVQPRNEPVHAESIGGNASAAPQTPETPQATPNTPEAPAAPVTPEAPPVEAPQPPDRRAEFREAFKKADIPVPGQGPRRATYNKAYLSLADRRTDPNEVVKKLDHEITLNDAIIKSDRLDGTDSGPLPQDNDRLKLLSQFLKDHFGLEGAKPQKTEPPAPAKAAKKAAPSTSSKKMTAFADERKKFSDTYLENSKQSSAAAKKVDNSDLEGKSVDELKAIAEKDGIPTKAAGNDAAQIAQTIRDVRFKRTQGGAAFNRIPSEGAAKKAGTPAKRVPAERAPTLAERKDELTGKSVEELRAIASKEGIPTRGVGNDPEQIAQTIRDVRFKRTQPAQGFGKAFGGKETPTLAKRESVPGKAIPSNDFLQPGDKVYNSKGEVKTIKSVGKAGEVTYTDGTTSRDRHRLHEDSIPGAADRFAAKKTSTRRASSVTPEERAAQRANRTPAPPKKAAEPVPMAEPSAEAAKVRDQWLKDAGVDYNGLSDFEKTGVNLMAEQVASGKLSRPEAKRRLEASSLDNLKKVGGSVSTGRASKATPTKKAEPPKKPLFGEENLKHAQELEAENKKKDAAKSAARDAHATVLRKGAPVGLKDEEALNAPKVKLEELAKNDPRAKALERRISNSDEFKQQSEYLRSGDSGRKTQDRDIALTDDLMNQSELDKPIVVYRGLSSLESVLGSEDNATGKTFTDKAFVSTTSNPRVATDFGNTQLRIKVPQGTKALRLGDTDKTNKKEDEILLDRGLEFKVTKDQKIGDQRVLDVEVVPKAAKATPGSDLDKMTIPQLRAEAKRQNKTIPSSVTRKADIVEILKGNENRAQSQAIRESVKGALAKQAGPPNLDTATTSQLRKIAADEGISIPKGMRNSRDDLAAHIEWERTFKRPETLPGINARIELFTKNPAEAKKSALTRDLGAHLNFLEGNNNWSEVKRNRIAQSLNDYMAEEGSASPWRLRKAGPDEQKFIKDIDSVMNESPLKQDTKLWRGIANASDIFTPEQLKGSLKGTSFNDPGYASTSPSREVSERFAESGAKDGVLTRLHVPKGTKGVHLADEDQDEVLLQRGLKFDVTGDTGPGSKPRILDVTVSKAPTNAPETPKAVRQATSKAPTVPGSPERFADIGGRLKATGTREEAQKLLSDEKLTVPQLRGLADSLNIAVRGNKDQILKDLVHWTVGRRLDSAAVSKPGDTGAALRKAEGLKPGVSTKPILPNHWGGIGGEINYHEDGRIGTALRIMGRDQQQMEVPGENDNIANVLGRLATKAVRGDINQDELIAKVKDVRNKMTGHPLIQRTLDEAVRDMDAQKFPVPELPDGTPAPIRKLMSNLNDIPLARQDRRGSGPGTSDLDRLADIMIEWSKGRMTPLGLISALQSRLYNNRHESEEGKFQLDRVIKDALDELNKIVKTDRKSLYPPITRS